MKNKKKKTKKCQLINCEYQINKNKKQKIQQTKQTQTYPNMSIPCYQLDRGSVLLHYGEDGTPSQYTVWIDISVATIAQSTPAVQVGVLWTTDHWATSAKAFAQYKNSNTSDPSDFVRWHVELANLYGGNVLEYAIFSEVTTTQASFWDPHNNWIVLVGSPLQDIPIMQIGPATITPGVQNTVAESTTTVTVYARILVSNVGLEKAVTVPFTLTAYDGTVLASSSTQKASYDAANDWIFTVAFKIDKAMPAVLNYQLVMKSNGTTYTSAQSYQYYIGPNTAFAYDAGSVLSGFRPFTFSSTDVFPITQAEIQINGVAVAGLNMDTAAATSTGSLTLVQPSSVSVMIDTSTFAPNTASVNVLAVFHDTLGMYQALDRTFVLDQHIAPVQIIRNAQALVWPFQMTLMADGVTVLVADHQQSFIGLYDTVNNIYNTVPCQSGSNAVVVNAVDPSSPSPAQYYNCVSSDDTTFYSIDTTTHQLVPNSQTTTLLNLPVMMAATPVPNVVLIGNEVGGPGLIAYDVVQHSIVSSFTNFPSLMRIRVVGHVMWFMTVYPTATINAVDISTGLTQLSDLTTNPIESYDMTLFPQVGYMADFAVSAHYISIIAGQAVHVIQRVATSSSQQPPVYASSLYKSGWTSQNRFNINGGTPENANAVAGEFGSVLSSVEIIEATNGVDLRLFVGDFGNQCIHTLAYTGGGISP